jgi:hypothetical protein
MEVFSQKPIKEKRPQGRQPKFSLEYMMMIGTSSYRPTLTRTTDRSRQLSEKIQ